MWADSAGTVTAEWQCTACTTTNRKLLPRDTTTAKDRCMHCGKKHLVSPGVTTVRWAARAA